MIIRLITCEAGHVHLIGPCPYCYHFEQGLLSGTVANDYKGRIHTVCMDCSNEVDYYIDAKEETLFELESVETKGSPSKSLQTIVEEAKKLETQIIAKEAENIYTQNTAEETENIDTRAKRRSPILSIFG